MNPFVLCDVDGVVIDYDGNERPGIRDLMFGFVGMGFDIKLWSGEGRPHAEEVAKRLELPCFSFHTKPPYPMKRGAVLRRVGEPALQLDDDPTERAGDWPFLLIRCEGNMPGRKARIA